MTDFLRKNLIAARLRPAVTAFSSACPAHTDYWENSATNAQATAFGFMIFLFLVLK